MSRLFVAYRVLAMIVGVLLAFCALVMVAACGDTVKFAYLPLYMSEQLHLPAAVRGRTGRRSATCRAGSSSTRASA